MNAMRCVPVVALLLTGCWFGQGVEDARARAQAGEVSPCVGRGTPPPGDDGQGSAITRVLLATSDDGLSWVRTGRLIADQGGAPGALWGPGGVRVYYKSHCHDDRMVVAESLDLERWTYRLVEFEGIPFPANRPADPHALRLDDGRVRLYFMAGVAGREIAVYTAVSDDGVRFAFEPDGGFDLPGTPLTDASVLRTGGLWRLFTIHGRVAVSDDGLAFSPDVDPAPPEMFFISGLPATGGYRYYGFSRGEIRSAFSPDGAVWTLEPGARLPFDRSNPQESQLVRDPSVVRGDDGRYWMFYTTVIPEG